MVGIDGVSRWRFVSERVGVWFGVGVWVGLLRLSWCSVFKLVFVS